MKNSKWPAIVIAAALGYGVPAASYAQEPMGIQGLVGTWLVEPLYYDLLVDAGLVLPGFPVLVIKPSGQFRLLRASSFCLPYDADGEAMYRDENPIGFEDACSDLRSGMREDGFNYAYGRLSASGRLEVHDNHLRFAVESTGPTPAYYRRLVDRALVALQGADAGLQPYIRDRQTQEMLQTVMASLRVRLDTFYTTFYIFNGTPLDYSVDGRLLRLTGSLPLDAIVYRAYSPEIIDAALAVAATLESSDARYFRCLVDRIDQTLEGSSTATDDLLDFVDLSRQIATLRPRRARSQALREAARTDEAARLWTEADEAQLQGLEMTAGAHPAFDAADNRRLGAFLGCPQRDQL